MTKLLPTKSRHDEKSKLEWWPALLALWLLASCSTDRATFADCTAIFDRIVELELQEMGYADQELLRRKQEQLRRRHQQEIASCTGKAIPAHALSCAANVSSTEELSHDCMR